MCQLCVWHHQIFWGKKNQDYQRDRRLTKLLIHITSDSYWKSADESENVKVVE